MTCPYIEWNALVVRAPTMAVTVSRTGAPVIRAGVDACLVLVNLVQSENLSPVAPQDPAMLETHWRNKKDRLVLVSLIGEATRGPVPPFWWITHPSMPKNVAAVAITVGYRNLRSLNTGTKYT